MQKLKKLGVLSVGVIVCLINLIMGLLMAIAQLIAMNNTVLAAMLLDPNVYALGSKIYWILILYPLVYGILGFVSGVVIAWLYNVMSKISGGISVELTEAPLKKPKKRK